MLNVILAHVGEATASAITNEMIEEMSERNFNHFMGDMMSFHWGGWSPVFIILWWLTWILVIITLVALIRRLWLKGDQKK